MSKKTVVLKRSLSLLTACIFLAVATVTVTAADVNLLDPGDAACETLDNFSVNTYNIIEREIDSTFYRSGTGSLKLKVPNNGDNGQANGSYQTYVGFKPTENIIEGEEYTFSIWYYNPENITGRMFLRFTSITGNSISNWVTGTAFDSGSVMSGNGWNKYEFVFTGTEKLATDLKYFYITTESGQGKHLYFDDAMLKKRDPADDYKAMVDEEVAACESDAALSSFNTNNVNLEKEYREISSEYAHTGKGSLKITIPGNYKTFVGVSPVIPIKEGRKYYFSAWYYNPEKLTGKLFLRYVTKSNEMAGLWITGTAYDSGAALSSGGWHKYEFTFTAAEPFASSVKYVYITAEPNEGTLYFDDLNLRLIPDEAASLKAIKPETGSSGVKLSEEIRLEFTSEVDKTDVDAEYFLNGEQQEKGSLSYELDGNDLLIKPSGGILPKSQYKIIINRVNDVCGRTVLENREIEFTTSDKVDFGVKLYDENDAEIQSVKQGTLKAEIDLKNNMSGNTGCVAVIMVCEGERVKKVYFTSAINLATDEQRTEFLTVDVPNDSCYLKAFLWSDATGNLRALANNIELR